MASLILQFSTAHPYGQPLRFSLLTAYLYGDQAAGNVARETPLWQAWFREHFPTPTEPDKAE
jgi:hypothetical protein